VGPHLCTHSRGRTVGNGKQPYAPFNSRTPCLALMCVHCPEVVKGQVACRLPRSRHHTPGRQRPLRHTCTDPSWPAHVLDLSGAYAPSHDPSSLPFRIPTLPPGCRWRLRPRFRRPYSRLRRAHASTPGRRRRPTRRRTRAKEARVVGPVQALGGSKGDQRKESCSTNGFAVPQLVPIRRPAHLRLIAHSSLELAALNFCPLP